MNAPSLDGQVALVTGGASGIGEYYCRGLAAAGAAVIVADIRGDLADRLVADLTGQGAVALAVTVDVADEASVAAMARRVAERFDHLDILVNNAALFLTIPLRPFWEIEAPEWDRVMAVNLRGPFLVTRALLPLIKPQGRGKIINVASGTPLKGLPGRLHYVTSKGGIIAMTRVMARELGEFGINVNTIAPGQTATKSYESAMGEHFFEKGVRDRSLKRLERPEDLVGTVLFLASSASDFMTGQTLVVDGGSVMV